MSITHALRAYEKPGHGGEEFFRIVANPQAFPLWISPRLRRYYQGASLRLIPCIGSYQAYSLKTYSESTSSQQTFAQVDSWFQDCKNNHEKCREVATDPKWYPTRLIDIGPLDTSSFVCRIINTGDENPHGPYMTLSHCWGSANSLILTKSNAAQLLEGIPPESLPRLYRDAACFVRKLGFTFPIFQAGRRFLPTTTYSSHLRRSDESKLSGRCGFLGGGGQASPRQHEGWVFQELLLSRRVVSFGERQVFWSCRSGRAAEIWPPGIPVKDPYEGPRIEDLQLGDNRARGKTKSTLKAYDCWSKIVVTYTSCKITFPSDRMIALSAIAKEMMKVLGDEYIAGMWRRHLESELLWRVPTVSTPSGSPPIVYRAPSWSWAAVDVPVAPGRLYKPDHLLIKVEDVHIEYVTGEMTGLISGGWLRLWGTLKQMKLYRREGPHRRDDDHHEQVWNIVVDGLNPREEQRENHVELDMFHDNLDEQNDKSVLYCMPAKWREVHVFDPETNGWTDRICDYELSMLLFELQDKERCLFRRLGIAHLSTGPTKENVLIRQEGESEFPCEEYLEGRHLIRII
ncbi:hypothetical protein CNYM01_04589 [Colletotrichum nymphaeae SA-01]|uniref:Heterokaryon incompatibility domain-containing protein n=1 Tax=Colletotrichum nymphaeae SA-01 TaxID=1460502 RepID=A0A135SYX8_9PEZI|nr:hypothetical protein CNYM01_04589 [Colletotrichum nymphaeae SA-01]